MAGQVVLQRPPHYHVLVHPAGSLVRLLGLDQEVGDGLLQTFDYFKDSKYPDMYRVSPKKSPKFHVFFMK